MGSQEEFDKAVALTDLNDRLRSLRILLDPLPEPDSTQQPPQLHTQQSCLTQVCTYTSHSDEI